MSSNSDPDVPSHNQSASFSGSDNLNVMIQGDGNVVILGRSRLELTLYRGRRREALSSAPVESGEAAEILSPYAMAVPLVGREQEKADLWAWMNSEAPLSIRVMTAPGGGGKTRLALVLCEEAVQQGWNAGFVKAAPSPESTTVKLTRPTLAVVDYAAARLPWLREWLDDLASSEKPERRLRVLLLERQADTETGWWGETIRSGGGGDLAIRSKLDPVGGIYPLLPLQAVKQRRAILEETLKSIGSDLVLPRPEERPDFDRRLAELSWGGEPLFLLMAAITAAKADLGYVLALDRSRLAFEVAEHELSRIGRIAESRVPRSKMLARHMAAYVTLCQGLTREQVEEAIEAEKRALRYESVGDPPEIYGALHDALPAAENAIAPILPDVVGEAAVLLALGDRDSGKAQNAVLRAAEQAPDRVPTTVMRIVQDFEGREARPLDWLNRLTEEIRDLAGLKRFVGQLPGQTVALREISARVTGDLLERLRKEGETEEVAGISNNLSVRLSALGRREEALQAVQESVDQYRSLSQSRPDAFLPDLASALNNLSNHLSALGRREEALQAVQESVDQYRSLSQSRPDELLPDLATSLNNLSNRLSALGRREEALKAAQESVEIRRSLPQSRPDAFLPGLAMSLNNLSNHLSALGRREEALQAVRESVDQYRSLSQSRPDAFLPDLARALSNLSLHLSALGRREEALEAVQESVDQSRSLLQSRPDAFLPDLAMSLNNLSNYLSALGRREEALEAVQESVDQYHSLSQSRPDAFLPDLARALSNLSIHLGALGRREEALEAVQESVDQYRSLSQSRPDAFLPDLARALNNLSADLSALGRREEALQAVEESVEIRRFLSQSRPDAFLPDLAVSLNNLSGHLGALGRREEALGVSEDAVRILLPFFQALPAAFQEWMVLMVRVYLEHSEESDRQPDPELIEVVVSTFQKIQPSEAPEPTDPSSDSGDPT